jgi:hypothetical protein
MKRGSWKGAAAAVSLTIVTATSVVCADYSQFKARMKARFAEQEPRLSLTAEQKQKLDPLVQASIDRRITILEKHGIGPGANVTPAALQPAMPEIQAENAQLRAALAAVLSQDQLKTYDDITQAMAKALLPELSASP